MMRQRFPDPAVRMCGQSREHILQIRIRVVAVQFRRLHQTHDGGRPFAGPQGTREQPVVAAHGDGPDLLFAPVIIDGQPPVVR